MDISYDEGASFPVETEDIENNTLSYDDTVPYEEQLPPPTSKPPRLSSRPQANKLYLLSDTLAEAGRGHVATGKVRLVSMG